MKPPTLEDFPTPNTHASLFVAYVSICKHMGDIAEAQRRQSLTLPRRQRLEDALFRWMKELPRDLRIAHHTGDAWATAPYNLEARQLAIPYFASLILLHRSPSPQAPTSTVCLMASSFLVSIFEEFLSRDHINCLGPVFAFYALAAGLIQLMCFRYKSLQAIAEHEFEVIKVALEELGKRWGSAHGALSGLLRAKESMKQQTCIEGDPPRLASNEVVFFSDFGPELCRTWDIGFGRSASRGNEAVADPSRRLEGWEYTTGMTPSAQGPVLPQVSQTPTGPLMFGDPNEAGIYASGTEDMNMFADPLALTEGSWLFQDFEYPGYFG
ncbi:fungal specific transcription factor domain-containing protein [Candidatus Bathyarchaeota archaeon]|nr:fungal specific transcription factor domain-containing protein [Candidatus Bathyarchaeota archaeon]